MHWKETGGVEKANNCNFMTFSVNLFDYMLKHIMKKKLFYLDRQKMFFFREKTIILKKNAIGELTCQKQIFNHHSMLH